MVTVILAAGIFGGLYCVAGGLKKVAEELHYLSAVTREGKEVKDE